ncbi:MAG TPA: hypothetical protein VK837_11775 [Longimicrobiales bacterium]|nr:hypothetical protein [Longimicrobiales bacterium]
MKPARGWAGVALALRSPSEDKLRSRLPTYVHPIAGRALSWHVLRSMFDAGEPADSVTLLSDQDVGAEIVAELPARVVRAAPDPAEAWAEVIEDLGPDVGRVLVVDAAAAVLGPTLMRLIQGAPGRRIRSPAGETLAVWVDLEHARAAEAPDLDALGEGLEDAFPGIRGVDFRVRDRASLVRAAAVIRARLVERLTERGATFLAPATVVVDVDVTIGPDTIVYPAVVLEGDTSIGGESVVGPGCRLVDAQVGSGVELKGWNYIVRARIRNRAVLEPYVRRGFD